MKRFVPNLILSTVLLVGPAFAHDNAALDAKPTPHSGQMRMAGPYHFELVPTARELVVYVTDHAGNKVPTKGVTGMAAISSGSTSTNVALRAARDNLVKGSGEFALPPDTTVSVSLSFPGRNPEKALFTPFKR